MIQPRSDFADMPELDYEGWRDALPPKWGRYNPEAMDRRAFIGRAPLSKPVRILSNRSRLQHPSCREEHNGMFASTVVDHYFVLFQVAGGSTIIQNDRVVQLSVGDAALVDSARPGTHVSEERCGSGFLCSCRAVTGIASWISTPRVVFWGGRTAAGRMFFDLVRDADTGDGSTSSPANFYMQLAVYDLIGALFAPTDAAPGSLHADKLFTRFCGVVRDRLAEPAFGSLRGSRRKQGSRCATFRSSSRRGARPARISSIRSGWITLRVSCIAGRR